MSRERFDPQTMPLDGIRLIEASAGTGKTFSLAGLYLRLLAEKRLSVREILVITFTRAATQELRERIRQRLVDAARIARDPESIDPDSVEDAFAEAVIANCGEPRAGVARRLAETAHRMDEATIATIHGFSQRAAMENAFDSALPFDRGEQVDDKSVYEEAVADYWRAHALGEDAEPGFADWWPTPKALSKALSSFWSQPHAQFTGPPEGEIRKLARRVRERWTERGADFATSWRECWADGALKKKSLKEAILKHGEIDDALALLTRRLESGQAIPAPPDWVAHLENPAEQFRKNEQKRGEALLNDPLAREFRRLHSLARLAALREALHGVRATAAERKRRRRQYSFADMIAALHRAVRDEQTGPRLAEALHATWPWALVDEFQDTDPSQYEILRRVYANRDSGGLILIGDPKQAIFGFRGGDVFAYLDAAADAGGRAYSLDTNFRSTQGLLDGIEALFKMPGDDGFLVEGIDYQRVEAGNDGGRQLRLDGKPVHPLTVWELALNAPNKGEAETACRDACVHQIRRLLDPARGGVIQETPLAARDIAVLVNTNRQAAEVQRALSELGVAAVCLHRDSVFASGEAIDVLHVLKAAASPSDEGLIRGALAGDLLGRRLGDLIALADDEPRWQEVVDRFQDAHQAWRDHGVLATLQPLIAAGAERLLTYVDGERRMSNYLQLAELLAEAENETFGMAGLLRRLREAIREAGGGEEAEQLRLESDRELVRIVTVHKAKGLEYPVVFVPFAPWLGAMGDPHKPPLKYHDDDRHALVDVIGSEAARDRAVREARAEGLRLLYVALTRAETACFLPWGAANGTPDGALASLLHREEIPPTAWGGQAKAKPLTDKIVHERLQALAEDAPHAIEVAPLPREAEDPGRLAPEPAAPGEARADLPEPRPPWSVYSFTRLVHAAGPELAGGGADDETEIVSAEEPPERLPDLPGGVAFGSAVHALLEAADPAEWPAPGEPPSEDRARRIGNALRAFGVSPTGDAVIAGASDLIGNALHTPVGDLGPLAQIPAARRRTEMEFMLRLNGRGLGDMLALLDEAGYGAHLPRERRAHALKGLMHGFIDLTVEHDGRFYVLDYKTNWLGPRRDDYAGDALTEAVRRRHYDLQYLIYTLGLHRHLAARLPGYDPARHLGGVYYLFLRGMAPGAGERGIYFDRPDPALIERLDNLLDTGAAA